MSTIKESTYPAGTNVIIKTKILKIMEGKAYQSTHQFLKAPKRICFIIE
jgi:hypothetical protein